MTFLSWLLAVTLKSIQSLLTCHQKVIVALLTIGKHKDQTFKKETFYPLLNIKNIWQTFCMVSDCSSHADMMIPQSWMDRNSTIPELPCKHIFQTGFLSFLGSQVYIHLNRYIPYNLGQQFPKSYSDIGNALSSCGGGAWGFSSYLGVALGSERVCKVFWLWVSHIPSDFSSTLK